jgi:hypothetical protein
MPYFIIAQHYTHLQRISMNQEEERAFPTGDEIGLLPDSPSDLSDGFMSSPCSPESASKVFLSSGSTGSLSFGENEEMTYLSCLLPGSNGSATMMNPQQQQPQTLAVHMAPASPGGTSSRSTSPTSWMFLSNPAQSPEMLADQQPGMELPVHPGSASLSHSAVSSPSSSGCLYCDQCQQASKGVQPTLHVVPNMPAVDDAAFIKQEPLTWLPEEMTSPVCVSSSESYGMQASSSCGSYAAYPGSSGLEQLPLYVTMPGLTGPSSPPSVEIALPLEDDWTAFLMDN